MVFLSMCLISLSKTTDFSFDVSRPDGRKALTRTPAPGDGPGRVPSPGQIVRHGGPARAERFFSGHCGG